MCFCCMKYLYLIQLVQGLIHDMTGNSHWVITMIVWSTILLDLHLRTCMQSVHLTTGQLLGCKRESRSHNASAFWSFSGFIIYKYLTLEIPNSNYNVPKYELLIYVSKGNDKTREWPKGGRCHVTYFTFCSPGAVLCQQNRRIICSVGV